MKKNNLLMLVAILSIFYVNITAQTLELFTEAQQKYKEKDYESSAKLFEQTFESLDATKSDINNDALRSFLYNAACSWSLAGNKKNALNALNKAVEKGYLDINQMKNDSDLVSLHNEKEWADILSKVEVKIKEYKEGFEKQLAEIDAKIKEFEKKTYKTLNQELFDIRIKDQLCRGMMGDIGSIFGWKSDEMRKLWKRQHVLDSTDLARIEEIIAQHGYPGKTLVGDSAKEVAFLVIQHSKLEVQKKYLPIIKEAAIKGEVSGEAMALLTDRILIKKGQKQIYGSQVRGQEFYPIEDEVNVNKRRAEVGLPPLEDYAKLFNIHYIPKTKTEE